MNVQADFFNAPHRAPAHSESAGDQAIVETVVFVRVAQRNPYDGPFPADSKPLGHRPSYIRNSPKAPFSKGAFKAADRPSPSTVRVSAGSMIPSSHRRAVA